MVNSYQYAPLACFGCLNQISWLDIIHPVWLLLQNADRQQEFLAPNLLDASSFNLGFDNLLEKLDIYALRPMSLSDWDVLCTRLVIIRILSFLFSPDNRGRMFESMPLPGL